MKKLIETTICARGNNSLWNSTNRIQSSPQNSKNNQDNTTYFLSKENQNPNEEKAVQAHSQAYSKKSQNFIQNKQQTSSQLKSINILRDKHNSQQVSCLYSQHIYKSMQRDYIHEAQLEKYRTMLDNQKQEKKKLLAEVSELHIDKARLLQQKEIILFALDSLTVKLDSQPSSKKNRQLRRQTTEALKSKLYSHQKLAMFNKIIQDQKKSSFKPETDTSQSCTSEKQQLIQNDQSNPNWQKIKIIRNLKQRLNIQNSPEIKNILHAHEKTQLKIYAVEQQCRKLKQTMANLTLQISSLKTENNSKDLLIYENNKSIIQLKRQLQQATFELKQEKQKLFQSQKKVKLLQEDKDRLQQEALKLNAKIDELVKQLKYTQQQYQSREQKEKQCVKILQRFSKQLKLSDEKIQQFLNTEIASYAQQIPGDLTRSKKTYQQHLCYILHLCKKKQTLYEHLVQQFKQRMKESDFRASILQKKLNNFSVYQEALRELVHNQSDKITIFRAILRFGH